MSGNRYKSDGLSWFFLICFGLTAMSVVFLQNQLAFLMPAVAAIAAKLLEKEKRAWFAPRFYSKARFYIGAWLVPLGLSVLGAGLFYLVFPGRFDPGMGYMAEVYTRQGHTFSASLVYQELFASWTALLLFQVLGTLGEEWGWRGFLLPRLLEKFSILKATLLSGLVWGLWHVLLLPTFLPLGSGEFWLAAGQYLAICVLTSATYTWLTLRTGSCLPAAIAHAAYNASTSFVSIYLAAGAVQPQAVVSAGTWGDWVAVFPHILAGLWCYGLLAKMQKRGEDPFAALPRRNKAGEQAAETDVPLVL